MPNDMDAPTSLSQSTVSEEDIVFLEQMLDELRVLDIQIADLKQEVHQLVEKSKQKQILSDILHNF